jgi:hypothetical protein
MKRTNLALLFSIMLLAAACSKDPDTTNTNISFQLKTWTSPVISQLIVWNLGNVWASQVKVQAYQSSNNQIEYRARIDSSLNIFNAARSVNLDIPSGHYQRLEFKTIFTQYLTHSALRMEGVYAGATPVVLESNATTEISAIKDTTTIEAIPYIATTKLDLSLLTTGITAAEMDGAVRTNGVIVISAFSNPGIYSKMMMNLATATSVDLSH